TLGRPASRGRHRGPVNRPFHAHTQGHDLKGRCRMARHTRRRVALVATIGLVTALAACTSGNSGSGGTKAAASVPGITATSVTVGSHQPLTGPAAPGYSKISPATKAYFDYVNAHGGVNGRKINYIALDDMYNPATTVTVVRQLVQQDKVFAILN